MRKDIRWYGECAVIVATTFTALADLRVHGLATFLISALCAVCISLITYHDLLYYRYHGVWDSSYGTIIRFILILIQVFVIEWIMA